MVAGDYYPNWRFIYRSGSSLAHGEGELGFPFLGPRHWPMERANWTSPFLGRYSGLSYFIGPASPLGPGGWAPIFKPHQLPPSPCVRIAWARAVIVPVSFAISTCRFGLALIAAISRMLIMTLEFRARLFRFDDLFNFASLWSLILLFIWRFYALLPS